MVSFSDADLEVVQVSHDDVMVITTKIGDSTVQMMLVNSSSDVLFLSAFQQIGINMKKLVASLRPLVGFTGHEDQILRSIDLPMVIREKPKVLMVKFLAIDLPSAYNEGL